MKIITPAQIEQIMKLIYQGNVPVQIYDTVDKILQSLPTNEHENKSN